MATIVVVGLGPGGPALVNRATIERLSSGARVFLRTVAPSRGVDGADGRHLR